ncbi:zinc ribbon domain-containing protein [Terrisporobacter petrolearius]|uniref:zinc ribbon domain-containing protein n=1 Tax=Terrisporobacter petrolearius TaxID=1460447 RepID=UPI003CCFF18C
MTRDVRTSPKEKRVFLFSGYLRCADCGRGMTRRTSKGYTYYSCKTYKTKSTKLCSSHTIRNKLIEETVLEAVKAQIALCEKLSETIYAINNALVRQKLVVNLLESKEVVLIKVTGILITCIWIGKWVKSPDNTIIE